MDFVTLISDVGFPIAGAIVVIAVIKPMAIFLSSFIVVINYSEVDSLW